MSHGNQRMKWTLEMLFYIGAWSMALLTPAALFFIIVVGGGSVAFNQLGQLGAVVVTTGLAVIAFPISVFAFALHMDVLFGTRLLD